MSLKKEVTPGESRFVVCISDDDEMDLMLNKVYRVLPDPSAERDGWIRVVDASGEDYLYPESLFCPIDLPPDVAEKIG